MDIIYCNFLLLEETEQVSTRKTGKRIRKKRINILMCYIMRVVADLKERNVVWFTLILIVPLTSNRDYCSGARKRYDLVIGR